MQAARILELPALVSEQYPKGLGHTAPEVGLQDEPRIEKTVFSAARAEGFDLRGASRRSSAGSRRTSASARPSTTCSPQGIEVHVPADAVGSRHELDYERGLERMERAGRGRRAPSRRSLFELLERAGTPEFKAVQKLIL